MKAKIQMFVMIMLLSGITYNSQAATKNLTEKQAQERVAQMKDRVEEIRAMNFSAMSSTERKAVKHELKDMKKEVREMGPIIIISAGALIVIIILILLLL